MTTTGSQATVVTGRAVMLMAAFAAWMFAGLENSLFILIHRQMMLELIGPETPEKLITVWFAWFQAAFLFGAAAGGWLFGWVGDRFGRTRAMGLSVLCYSSLTLLCYFVHEPHLMWLVRFTACLGFGGSWPNAVALVSEAWPSASRPLMAGVMGTAANFGFVLLGIIGFRFAITEDHWRRVFFVGGSPLLIGLAILMWVPESAKWLAAKRNPTAAAQSTAPLKEVFRPPLLTRTLLGIGLGAIPVVGTAANANWVVPWRDQFESRRAELNVAASAPESVQASVAAQASANGSLDQQATDRKVIKKSKGDPRQKAWTQMTRSTGAIFGSLLGGYLASLLGRRLAYFMISLMTFAISSWLFGYVTPADRYFDLYVFLLGFFGVTYFGWLPLFLPELFPTSVRSTGTGISFNTGRVVAAMVVLTIALLPEGQLAGDYARIGFWTGMIYVVGMAIIWLAPTKRDSSFEQ